jgi:hypothetical protein
VKQKHEKHFNTDKLWIKGTTKKYEEQSLSHCCAADKIFRAKKQFARIEIDLLSHENLLKVIAGHAAISLY